ncbi:MAG: hypothetical protein WC733_02130 [Methylophilus sp.]|jgi:hypothetical protein
MGLLDFDANKLAGNPLLQMGMGILANNSGNYGQFAPAFGRGISQGMQNANMFAQQQNQNELLKQRAEMQNKEFEHNNNLYDLQKEEHQQKLKQYQDTQSAIDEASKLHPEYAPLFRLDPKAAIKALYPNADSGADPTPDIKNYEYAKRQGYKGDITDFIKIKPQAMYPIAAANLGIAQQKLGIDQAQADYSLPKPAKSKPSGYSISAGGKTYTFPDQKSLNNFKLKAGLR